MSEAENINAVGIPHAAITHAAITDAIIKAATATPPGEITSANIDCCSLPANKISSDVITAEPIVALESAAVLLRTLKEAATECESSISNVLDDLAYDKITINDARERLGLKREPLREYNIKIRENGVECGKDLQKREYASAMYDVIKGEKTPNDALCDAGFPTINDCRANKKLVPEPEPPAKPDVYIASHGPHYEMVFHTGEFKRVGVRFDCNLSAYGFTRLIENTIRAYWRGDQPPVIAYDPWAVNAQLRTVMYEIGAVAMKTGDAFKAIFEG